MDILIVFEVVSIKKDKLHLQRMRYFVIAVILFFVSGQPLIAQKVTGNFSSDTVQIHSSTSEKELMDSQGILAQNQSDFHPGTPGQGSFQKNKIALKENWYFYYFYFLLLFFALIKLAYPRYFFDLFRVFFRTSLKVNQIKEQLAVSLWQSLLYNVLFFLSAGFYLFLILKYFKYSSSFNDFTLILFCTSGLFFIYTVKYLFLRFAGWLLNVYQAADTYLFVVFLVNKMAGVMLLPVAALIAFAPVDITGFVIWGSLFILGIFLLYRSLLGYQTAQSVSHLSNFHFLLFILAMEAAPLLVLFRFLSTIL